jgi:hypothetical protein
MNEWHGDVKNILQRAGSTEQHVVFLFSDSQVISSLSFQVLKFLDPSVFVSLKIPEDIYCAHLVFFIKHECILKPLLPCFKVYFLIDLCI